jgi:hypothetical protein
MIGNIKARRVAQGRSWKKRPPWTLCRWLGAGLASGGRKAKLLMALKDFALLVDAVKGQSFTARTANGGMANDAE